MRGSPPVNSSMREYNDKQSACLPAFGTTATIVRGADKTISSLCTVPPYILCTVPRNITLPTREGRGEEIESNARCGKHELLAVTEANVAC